MPCETCKKQSFQRILWIYDITLINIFATQMRGEADIIIANCLYLFLYFLREPNIVLVGNGHIVARGFHGCALKVQVEP